jgi:hypothetical protein
MVCRSQSICRSTLLSLRSVGYLNPQGRSVPKVPAYLPFTIPNNKDKLGDPRVACSKNEVLDHRAVGKREHYLRALRRKGAHPLPFSCGKNDTLHTLNSYYNI